MSDSLEDFLGSKKNSNQLSVSGSMRCQECNEIVHQGMMNENDMVISYSCSKGHQSKVKL
jgi:hypothetical protein